MPGIATGVGVYQLTNNPSASAAFGLAALISVVKISDAIESLDKKP